MTYAITNDVATQLGRPAASNYELDQWQAWLDVVERAIRRGFKRVGLDLDAQLAAGAITSADVGDVEVAAVIRKVQNPTWGETSYTRSIDDASETRRAEGAGKVDPLSLLADEWALLLPSGRDSGRVFSVMPS